LLVFTGAGYVPVLLRPPVLCGLWMDDQPVSLRENMENTFSEWLINELQKRSWTQRDLAKQSGLHPSTINYIITNHRGLGLKSIHKLAQALGVPEELIIDKYENHRPSRESSDIISKACYVLRELPQRDKEEILAFIYLKRQLAEENGEYNPPEN
jgi:transcriptional regulator with XRE-family HTH domain